MAEIVSISQLNTYLQTQEENTVDTPYEIEIIMSSWDDIDSIAPILKANPTKFVDLKETHLWGSFSGTRKTNFSQCFMGCTSLVVAPAFMSNTYVAEDISACFKDCTNLRDASEVYCTTYWDNAFENCTSLVEFGMLGAGAPYQHSCYYRETFKNCTSLREVRYIHDSDRCNYTFAGCINLQYKPIVPGVWPDAGDSQGYHTFDGVTATIWKGYNQTSASTQDYVTQWARKQSSNSVEFIAETLDTNETIYGVDIDNLNTWLNNQEPNATDSPYKLCIVNLSLNNVYDIKTILMNNEQKFVDLNNTKYPNYTNPEYTFSIAQNDEIIGCKSLIRGPAVLFDYTNYDDLLYTYAGCENLIHPGAYQVNIAKMTGTFKNCKSLLANRVSIGNATELNSTFEGCTGFTSISYNFRNVTSAINTFKGCTSLTQVLYFTEVDVMTGIFSGCINLETITFRNGTIPTVTNMDESFKDCVKLQSLKRLTVADSAKRVFSGCTKLNSIEEFYIPLNSLKNNANFQDMFLGCNSLKSIGYKINESENWHLWKLIYDSGTVEGKIFNADETYTSIPQTSITKTTLQLPVLTDELWFPDELDADIEAIIQKMLTYKYGVFKKKVLPPDEKSFVLIADDPNNVVSNILENSKVTITSSRSLSISKDTRAIIEGANITLTLPATGSTNGSILELFTTNNTSIVYYTNSNTSATQTINANSRILFVYYNGWRFVGTYGAVWN